MMETTSRKVPNEKEDEEEAGPIALPVRRRMVRYRKPIAKSTLTTLS